MSNNKKLTIIALLTVFLFVCNASAETITYRPWTATASATVSSHTALHAIDNITTTYFQQTSGSWLQLDYNDTNSKTINQIGILTCTTNTNNFPRELRVHGSNDASNYTLLFEVNATFQPAVRQSAINQWYYFNFTNNESYRYYKITPLYCDYSGFEFSGSTSGSMIYEIILNYVNESNRNEPDWHILNTQTRDFPYTSWENQTAESVSVLNNTEQQFIGEIITQESPVTNWFWDLDGDGTIDSTLQNPTHTYTTLGNVSVTLTTTVDSINKTSQKYVSVVNKFDYPEFRFGAKRYAVASGSTSSHGVALGLDKNPTTYWQTTADGGWIEQGYNDSPIYNSVRVHYASGAYGWQDYYPVSFNITASNDRSTWVTLYDEYGNFTSAISPRMRADENRYLNFTNTNGYKYYRLNSFYSYRQVHDGDANGLLFSDYDLLYSDPQDLRPNFKVIGWVPTRNDLYYSDTGEPNMTLLNGTTYILNSTSTSGYPITTYAWDIHNDGSTEGTAYNYTLTPNTIGTYQIKLSVADTFHTYQTKIINVTVIDNEFEPLYDADANCGGSVSSITYGDAGNLFDGTNVQDSNNIWYTNNGQDQWVKMDYGTQPDGSDRRFVINGYTFRATNDYPYFGPQSYSILGSNDNLNWIMLENDTIGYNRVIARTTTTSSTNLYDNTFNGSFYNTNAYRYYLFLLNTSMATRKYDDNLALSELRLYYNQPSKYLQADAYIDGDGYYGITTLQYRARNNQTYTVMTGKPFNVHDITTGNPKTWAWDMDGDGATDVVTQNFTYTFNTPGVYNATYTVGDGARTSVKYFQFDVNSSIEYWYYYGRMGGNASAVSTNWGSPDHAFDGTAENDVNNIWRENTVYPYAWIQMYYGNDESHIINQIQMGLSQTYPTEFPRQFMVAASNNGYEWTTLDSRLTVGNQLLRRKTASSNDMWVKYNFTNNNSYKYYRLYLNSSTPDTNSFQYSISEIQLLYHDDSILLDPSFYVVDDGVNGEISQDDMYTVNDNGQYIYDTITLQTGREAQFKDSSLGEPTGWYWDFGDNTSSVLQNPTHTYNTAGIYNMSLTVSRPGYTTAGKTMRVFVNDAFEYAYYLYIANSTPVTKWGATASGTYGSWGSPPNPLNGVKTARAIATGWGVHIASGTSLPAWWMIDWANVNSSTTKTINEITMRSTTTPYDLPRSFHLEGSNDTTVWDMLYNFTESYDTIREPVISNGTVTYGFDNNGSYRHYRLTIISTGNDCGIAEINLKYHNPDTYIQSDFYANRSIISYDDVSNKTYSRTVFLNEEVRYIDGSIGTGLSYYWDFGDGSVSVSTKNANHTYSTAGTYIVTHNVSKGSATSSRTMYVTVAPDAVEPAYGQRVTTSTDNARWSGDFATPTIHSTYYPYNAYDHSIATHLGWNQLPEKSAMLDYGGGKSNMSGVGDGWTYPAINMYVIKTQTAAITPYMPISWQIRGSNDAVSWNVLDTQTDTPNWSVNEIRIYNFTNVVPYRYYNITVTKINGSVAGIRIPELNYFIRPTYITTTPPVASFVMDRTNISTYGGQIQFHDTSVTGGTPSSWYWMFGDGTTSTEQHPIHWYSVQGNYTVNLTATNAGGSDVSSNKFVNVDSDFDTQIKTWLQFNHSVANDRVGNAWTSSGGITFNATVKPGFGNGSLYSDGINDFLSSTSQPGYGMGNNNITLELWFKRSDADVGVKVLVSKGSLTNTSGGYALMLDNNKLTFRAYNSELIDSLSQLSMISPIAITDTDWHFATVQRGGGEWKLYLDGVVNDTKTWAYTVSNNASYPLRIAGSPDVGYYFRGHIDEFRLGTKNRWDNNTFQTPFHEYMSSEQLMSTVLPSSGYTVNISSGVAPLTVGFTDISTNEPTSWYWDFGDGTGTYPFTQHPTHTYTSAGSYTPILVAANDGGNSTVPYSSPTPITVIEPVVTNFTGSPTIGSSPVTVYFTDYTTGGPTNWFWDFGDGGSSSLQNPSHVYTTNGTYNVSLISSNIAGSDSMLRVDYITVLSIPVATFTSNQTSGYFPATIQFYDTSTGAPTSWMWDFGDGGFSTDQNPVHTFISEATFNVRMTCSNVNGNSSYNFDVVIVPAESSIKTQAVVINASTGCVYFVGTNEGSPTNVWFEYGMNQTQTGGKKSFKTPNQSGITGNFTFKQCGIPILPGKQYLVVAGGDVMGEYVYGANRSFSLAAPTPHVTTTYEDQVNTFVEDGLDPIQLLTYDMWQPYLGLMGGLFFGILIAFVFMNIAIKQRTIAMTIILLFLTGAAIWGLMPAAFIQIAQMLFIAGVAGLLYWLFMKRR